MTRTYAAKRLLEHGPLTFANFMEITGWSKKVSSRALSRLCEFGQARLVNIDGHRHYELC